MKYTFACLATTALTAFAGVNDANANEKRWPQWYFGLSGGIAFQDDSDVGTLGEISYDDGYSFGASLGYKPQADNWFMNHTRFEVEVVHSNSDIDGITAAGVPTLLGGQVENLAFMFNSFYDFTNSTRWTPYLGAGAGATRVDFSSGVPGIDGEETIFAYQFMGGLNYSPEMIPFVDVGLGYRYFASLDPETVPGLEVENASHNIELNAHFNF